MYLVKFLQYLKPGKASWETIAKFEHAADAEEFLTEMARETGARYDDFNIVYKEEAKNG